MHSLHLPLRHIACTAAIAAALLAPQAALGNPKPLPFTYPYATLGEGEVEVEQYVDTTPVRIPSGQSSRGVVTPLFRFQTEFEVGITDRLELGLYAVQQPFMPDVGAATPAFPGGGNGIKQRLKLRLAEAGEWPVDVALYGEISELSNEIELEAKIILERRIGRLRAMVNLWAEREFYYDGRKEWVLHPTAGATFQITPSVHVGAEYWMLAELGDNDEAVGPASFNASPHHFAGPTALFQLGRLWWSTGAYARLDHAQRSLHIGDVYGHVWVRTIIGIGF